MTSCTPGRCAPPPFMQTQFIKSSQLGIFFCVVQALLQMIVQLQQSGSLSTPTSGSAVVTAPHAEAKGKETLTEAEVCRKALHPASRPTSSYSTHSMFNSLKRQHKERVRSLMSFTGVRSA